MHQQTIFVILGFGLELQPWVHGQIGRQTFQKREIITVFPTELSVSNPISLFSVGKW